MTDHDLNRLAAFVEQRLDETERADVLQHLATCGECREIVAGLMQQGIGTRRAETQPGLRTEVRTGLRTAIWLPIAASLVIAIGAGWLVLRRDEGVAPPPIPEAPRSESPKSVSEPGPQPPSTPATNPGTTLRSAGEREVGGRRFKLEAGTWMDTGYDQFALLPVVDVRTPGERDALLDRVPGLKPFLILGPKVTVVYQGTVYRFDLPR